MKLKKLFMGLQLVRIEHDRLTLASAGMPPILIYHHSTGNVETIIQKAMPLGGPAFFPYKQTETSLQRNDVVVMMSDGITERFNQDKMMLGQEPLKEWLKESAGQTAETILNTLLIKTNDWAKTEQRDDITLIILKII